MNEKGSIVNAAITIYTIVTKVEDSTDPEYGCYDALAVADFGRIIHCKVYPTESEAVQAVSQTIKLDLNIFFEGLYRIVKTNAQDCRAREALQKHYDYEKLQKTFVKKHIEKLKLMFLVMRVFYLHRIKALFKKTATA